MGSAMSDSFNDQCPIHRNPFVRSCTALYIFLRVLGHGEALRPPISPGPEFRDANWRPAYTWAPPGESGSGHGAAGGILDLIFGPKTGWISGMDGEGYYAGADGDPNRNSDEDFGRFSGVQYNGNRPFGHGKSSGQYGVFDDSWGAAVSDVVVKPYPGSLLHHGLHKRLVAGKRNSDLEFWEDPFLKGSDATAGPLRPMKYQLYLPNSFYHYPPKNSTGGYPLVVFLHGAGDGDFSVGNQQSLPRLLDPDNCWKLEFDQQQYENCTFFQGGRFSIPVLMPQSGVPSNWSPPIFDQVLRLTEWLVKSTSAPNGMSRINRDHVVLIGQSAGGRGALEFAARHPTDFAGVVAICPAGLDKQSLLKWVDDRGSRQSRSLNRVPLWLVHSADDSVIPVSYSDELYQGLKGVRESVGKVKKGQRSMVRWIQQRNEYGGPGFGPLPAAWKPGVGPTEVRYTRYEKAPGPPIPEFAHLTGHASYDLIFRDSEFWRWIWKEERPWHSSP